MKYLIISALFLVLASCSSFNADVGIRGEDVHNSVTEPLNP